MPQWILFFTQISFALLTPTTRAVKEVLDNTIACLFCATITVRGKSRKFVPVSQVSLACMRLSDSHGIRGLLYRYRGRLGEFMMDDRKNRKGHSAYQHYRAGHTRVQGQGTWLKGILCASITERPHDGMEIIAKLELKPR